MSYREITTFFMLGLSLGCSLKIKQLGTPASTSSTTANAPGTISTIAGSALGTAGYSGDSGPAMNAELHSPAGLAIDNAENIFISEIGNNVVRMIPAASANCFGMNMTAGSIYTIAGTGTASYSGDEAAATSATLNGPYAVTTDGNGDLFISDTGNNVIRMVAATPGSYFNVSMNRGFIYTIAGNGTGSYSGDGASARSAELATPYGIQITGLGSLIFSDTGNARIRMVPVSSSTYYTVSINAENIDTIAGTGTAGDTGDTSAALSADIKIMGIALAANGDLYLADPSHNVIRMISATTTDISTVAGGGVSTSSGIAPLSSSFNHPSSLSLDSLGNLIIVDNGNNTIRMLAANSGTYYGISMLAGNIYTVAGNGSAGFTGDGGQATQAKLNAPWSIALDSSGNLYIADTGNHAIRKVLR